MKGVLDYTEEQLVSNDYIGNPASRARSTRR
jgi:glyceraldehyde-3-phosphate dehydrogenase/erythrose-4-phosphate dehydrogenase